MREALPAAEYERLRPHLEPVVLGFKEMLYTRTPIDHVYFPLDSVASLLSIDDGGAIEMRPRS